MMRLWLLLLCVVVSPPAFSNNGATQERMMSMASELRCLVCQNETIAASRSDFAVDIRELIVRDMKAGKSDAEIRDFLVSRYGDFILYRPPVKASTLLLWLGPALLLLFGFLTLAVTLYRRKQNNGETQLSEEEKEMAEALLGRGANRGGSL